MTYTQPTPTTDAGIPVQSDEHPINSVSAPTIAGITIPDTPLVRDVTALIREAMSSSTTAGPNGRPW
jgi:hypothetical protein